jgi:hypothetical protein
MRRHLIGIGLAIVMVLAMFFAGAWGYVRLLRLPANAGGPLSALPAQGGSLLSNGSVLAALGAMAGTAILAGILVAAPRISALAAGLPGLFAIAWQVLYLVSVHRAVQIIPLRAHAFGAGWESLLFNGILGAAGLALIIPLFLPSRWRGRGAREDDHTAADVTEATDYMADLRANVKSAGSDERPIEGVPTGAIPVGATSAGRPRMSAGGAPRASTGDAPTSANPVVRGAAPTRPPRTGLVGEPRRANPAMRPRPYRRSADDL